MSKKSLAVGGLVAAAAIIIAVVVFVGPSDSSAPDSTPGAAARTSQATTGTANATTGTKKMTDARDAKGDPATADKGGKPSSNSKTPAASEKPLTPFSRMDDPGLPAKALTSPERAGEPLAPITEAPDPTISALKIGILPEGATYQIVTRPYGIGPDSPFGTRLVLRVDSAKPLGGTPANKRIAPANLLVVVDTTRGGAMTKGGTYTAILSFRSDGSKLLPVIRGVEAK